MNADLMKGILRLRLRNRHMVLLIACALHSDEYGTIAMTMEQLVEFTGFYLNDDMTHPGWRNNSLAFNIAQMEKRGYLKVVSGQYRLDAEAIQANAFKDFGKPPQIASNAQNVAVP